MTNKFCSRCGKPLEENDKRKICTHCMLKKSEKIKKVFKGALSVVISVASIGYIYHKNK